MQASLQDARNFFYKLSIEGGGFWGCKAVKRMCDMDTRTDDLISGLGFVVGL